MTENSSRIYLAVDLGASSGRVLAGQFDGRKLVLHEMHRFENGPFQLGNHAYWNVLSLWQSIQDGLRKSASELGSAICSLGVDTWGVDFALLGRNDELLGNPYHYRDPQTNGMVDEAAKTVSREEIFAETGLQFMDINSLYQLLAMKRANSTLLESAQTFLMMPDLFHFLLTGEKSNEFTDATTTQFLNPNTRDWSRSLMQKFGLRDDFLLPIQHPGTNLGSLRASVAAVTGLKNVDVILPGTHDTASAVVAVPAEGAATDKPDWCYISCGTWSLMGAEITAPIVTDQCREFNFTNEGGVGGTIRLLKNITGLWLVQECRRVWALEGRDMSWSELTGLVDDAAPLRSLIEPDHSSFLAPSNMPEAIVEYCKSTGQTTPESKGAIMRCALESVALKYRLVLEMLESLTGTPTKTIHMVGGGTQNRQLCQMTADACNRVVLAGPIEATAIGNVVTQAISKGDISSIQEARQIIRNSFELQTYEPSSTAPWDDAFERFKKLS